MLAEKTSGILAAALVLSLCLTACSKAEKEVEPVASVQIAVVKQAPIQEIISAEASCSHCSRRR